MSSLEVSSKHGYNERALKYVIDTVDSLCDEISKVSETDSGKQLRHLQLSTAKILDELEMPSVECARHEVALLAQLQKSLSRLVDRGENILRSPEMVQRLKKFREEMQQLFNSSQGTWVKIQRIPQKPSIEILSPYASDDQTTSVGAPERTKTPTEEAHRPGHDKERSDDATELHSSILRKVHDLFSPAAADTTSDSDATRTQTPGSVRNPPEEKSQRIWMDEELKSAESPVNKGAIEKSPSPSRSPGYEQDRSDIGIQSPTVIEGENVDGVPAEERANLIGVAGEEPTILKGPLQASSTPRRMKAVKLPQMVSAGEAVQMKPTRSLGTRKKTGIQILSSPASNRTSGDQTSSVGAPERTKTPTAEAHRPGHEKERSDEATELHAPTLRKVHQLCSPATADTTSDSDATKQIVSSRSKSAGVQRKLMVGIAVFVLPFALLWLIVVVLEFGRHGGDRMNAGLVGWQMACHVANSFCENYGSFCSSYCASGVQLQKWGRN